MNFLQGYSCAFVEHKEKSFTFQRFCKLKLLIKLNILKIYFVYKYEEMICGKKNCTKELFI